MAGGRHCFPQAGSREKVLGTKALRLCIDHLYTAMPFVRVDVTTCSGNGRMMRVGEKLSMQIEARIRKVRYYDGHHYDSIRMGVPREEWEENS